MRIQGGFFLGLCMYDYGDAVGRETERCKGGWKIAPVYL